MFGRRKRRRRLGWLPMTDRSAEWQPVETFVIVARDSGLQNVLTKVGIAAAERGRQRRGDDL